MTNKEYLDWLHSYKNASIEMPLNENGYSATELFETMFPSSLFLMFEFYKYGTNDLGYANVQGNIYDIDDNYIYCTTCSHQLNNDLSGYTKFWVYFYDDSYIEIPISINDIYIDGENDFCMFKIKKSDVSNNVLSSLRSLNTSNLYNLKKEDVNNLSLSCYKYDYRNSEYITCVCYGFYYKNGHFAGAKSSVQSGCSGGAFFDKYGNIWGTVYNTTGVNILKTKCIEAGLLYLNPNYFN